MEKKLSSLGANKSFRTVNKKVALIIFLIIFFIAFLGMGWHLFSRIEPLPQNQSQLNIVELSQDKKSVLNAETKEVIFTIEEANQYLKNYGYAYNPETFQTTDAKYAGDCFEEARLSNDKKRIVFSTDCVSGDLPQAWVGVYELPQYAYSSPTCSIKNTWCKVGGDIINFLIAGSGRNFVWSADDKTIAYETDFRLEWAEKRTIDAVTGEILETEPLDDGFWNGGNNDISDWETYRNEEYGYEIKYPKNWLFDDFSGMIDDEIILSNVLFSSPDENGGEVIISVYDNSSKKLFLEDWLNFYTTEYNDCLVNSKEKTSILGIEGIKAVIACGDVITENIFLAKGDKIYDVEFLLFVTEFPIEGYEETYEQMLSTFKFIGIDETADWKTYRNEEYGFEMKYPLIFEFENPEQASDGSKIILGYLRAKSKDGEETIGIIVKQEKLNPENIIGLYGKIENKDIKNIMVDGRQSYTYREGDAGCGGSIVLIPDDDKTFQISFIDCQIETQTTNFNSAESYMEKILSTFKFIEEDEEKTN